MFKKILKMIISFVVVGSLVVGCSSQKTQPTPAAPATQVAPAATTALSDVIKNGLPGFSVGMSGVSDSFDNLYYSAKGGNWALSAYMSDVMQDYMSPTQITRIKDYPQWDSFVKGNLGDDSALKKAMDAKDMVAFEKAYSDTINNCNGCHTALGFKYIKKIKASGPEANLDYSLQSITSENK